jgi:hypothetical protein
MIGDHETIVGCRGNLQIGYRSEREPRIGGEEGDNA